MSKYLYYETFVKNVNYPVIKENKRSIIRTYMYAIDYIPISSVDTINNGYHNLYIELKDGTVYRDCFDTIKLSDNKFSREELDKMAKEEIHYYEYFDITYIDRIIYVTEQIRERFVNEQYHQTKRYYHDIQAIIYDCEKHIIGKPKDNYTLAYAQELIRICLLKDGYKVNELSVEYIDENDRKESDGNHIIRVKFDDETFINIVDLI